MYSLQVKMYYADLVYSASVKCNNINPAMSQDDYRIRYLTSNTGITKTLDLYGFVIKGNNEFYSSSYRLDHLIKVEANQKFIIELTKNGNIDENFSFKYYYAD